MLVYNSEIKFGKDSTTVCKPMCTYEGRKSVCWIPGGPSQTKELYKLKDNTGKDYFEFVTKKWNF